MDGIIDTARKLLMLSERGATEHEKGAARKKLDSLLLKHGLKLEDLDQQKREWVKFLPKDKWETEILFQCIFKVRDASKIEYSRTSKAAKNILVRLTPAEKADVDTLFNYYRKVWEEELQDFLSAFLSKHRLFPDSAENPPAESEIDYLRLKRLMRLMDSMKSLPSPLTKVLPGGK